MLISPEVWRRAIRGKEWRCKSDIRRLMSPGHLTFDHLALLYDGEDEFVERTLPFVREGILRDAPVMVVTSAGKCTQLAAALDGDAERVEFLDMREIGRNPATILPVWQRFADRHRNRPIRGIGEPAWADRSSAELDECEHHESLLNLAFADGPELELVCPYDRATLGPQAIDAARRTHPRILDGGRAISNPDYIPPEAAPGPLDGDLPPAPADATTLEIDDRGLSGLRRFVSEWGAGAGLPHDRAHDLTLAVHELAGNSLRHAGGSGTLRAWREDGVLLCEVRDGGSIAQPLVGRRAPDPRAAGGRGLWLVNHLCDLVQIRSRPDGCVVRVRMEISTRGRPGES